MVRRVHLFIIVFLFIFLNFGNNNSVSGSNKKDKFESNIMINTYRNIIGTVYYAVSKQTDSTPLITADLSYIDTLNLYKLRWVALSRDLIKNSDIWGRNWNGRIKFGDSIFVDSPHPEINGWWVVHDVMNKRYTKRIDFLQPIGGIFGKWDNITIKTKRK